MEVRKRVRMSGPVKIEGLKVPASDPELGATTDQARTVAELPLALLGVLELMGKLANSDLRVLLSLVKLSCVFSGPIRVDQTRLAKLSGVQRSTIADAARRLQDCGFISIQRSNVGISNTYIVKLDVLKRAARKSLVWDQKVYPVS